MFKSNHMEPDKITLVRWVHHALEQSFTLFINFRHLKKVGIFFFIPKHFWAL